MPYAFGPQDAVEFPVRCARRLLDTARKYQYIVTHAMLWRWAK